MVWDIFHWSYQNIPGFKYPQWIPTGYFDAGSSSSGGIVSTSTPYDNGLLKVVWGNQPLSNALVSPEANKTIRVVAVAAAVGAGLYFLGGFKK